MASPERGEMQCEVDDCTRTAPEYCFIRVDIVHEVAMGVAGTKIVVTEVPRFVCGQEHAAMLVRQLQESWTRLARLGVFGDDDDDDQAHGEGGE